MNVSSVFAATTATPTLGSDANIKAISKDTSSYLYYYTIPTVSADADTTITAQDASGNTYTGSVKISQDASVSFTINGTSLTAPKAKSKASNNVVKGITAGQTVVFDLYVNSDTNCKLNFHKGSSAKDNYDEQVTLTNRTAYQVSVSVDEAQDLYFYNDQQLVIANIGVKNSAAADGTVTLTETGADNGTTSVTVGGNALVSGTKYDANSSVVVTAVPKDGYTATVKVNNTAVNLSNNSYTFTVNGDAAISVEYTESKEICKYNISKTGVVALEDGKITFDDGYNLAIPKVTTVKLEDGTETSFTQGALPDGSTQKVNATLNAGDTITVYYTVSDSKYTTADQSKTGYAVVLKNGTQVAADTNTNNKTGNIAYKFSYQATTDGEYAIKSSANRFVVYGIDYTPVTTNEYDLTAALYENGDYSSAITSEDGKLVVNADSFNGTQHGVVFSTGKSFTLDVDGASTILLGGCKFSNGSVKVTTADGTVVKDALATKTDGCYDSTKDTVKIVYNGDATTLTFAFTDTTYIPHISVINYVSPTVTIGITLKDADGKALANVPVNLKLGSAVYTATTDSNGKAEFDDKLPDTYQVYTAQYALSNDSITVTSNEYDFSLTATENSYEELPSTASADDGKLYVGFVDSDSDYTGTIYYSVQSAHDAATGDADIVLGKGTYYEQLKITKNTTITGTTSNPADTVITFDDNADTSKNGFHGDTIAILNKGVTKFNAANITIQNSTAEALKKNATALSVYADSAAVAVGLDNVVLDTFCDTVYLGKTNNQNVWTINNSVIKGYQDTICGNAQVTLNDCTWDVYTTDNAQIARLFAPTGNSVNDFTTRCIANNLTITNSLANGKTGTNIAFFGRGWGQKDVKLVGKVEMIINGYTDDMNLTIPNGEKSYDNNYTSLIGFDTKLVGTDSGEKLTSLFCVARKNQTDNYVTTMESLDTANAFVSATAETADNSVIYRIIGKVNSALVTDENASSVGLAVYNSNGSLFANIADNKVYTNDDTNYYTVYFAEDVDTSISAKVKSYVKYNTYDIESVSDTDLVFTSSN
jgi:formylmethanofuran dehydrogenase subunit D